MVLVGARQEVALVDYSSSRTLEGEQSLGDCYNGVCPCPQVLCWCKAGGRVVGLVAAPAQLLAKVRELADKHTRYVCQAHATLRIRT